MKENRDSVPSLVLVMPNSILRYGLELALKDADFSNISIFDDLNSIDKICKRRSQLLLIYQEIIAQDNINKIEWISRETGSAIVILGLPQVVSPALDEIGTKIRGYISLNESKDVFINQLKMLAKGCIVISGSIVDEVATYIMTTKDKNHEILSNREKEVLISVAKGNTNNQVAEELFISEHTVKVHLRSILNKLNLNNRQQVIAYAWENGIVA